eukprot:gene17097-23525_t
MFGFGRTNISTHVTKFEGPQSHPFDFTFSWGGAQLESASYEPLQKHLMIVSEGQGLPDGILYREELWTLKKNTSLRSVELRKSGEEPIFKYILYGRTDLVTKKMPDMPLGKSNNN